MLNLLQYTVQSHNSMLWLWYEMRCSLIIIPTMLLYDMKGLYGFSGSGGQYSLYICLIEF